MLQAVTHVVQVRSKVNWSAEAKVIGFYTRLMRKQIQAGLLQLRAESPRLGTPDPGV